jgi:protein-disulfide isomerase
VEDQNLTKKEKRELARQVKKEEQEKKNKVQVLKKLFVWFLTACVVIFAGYKAWNWISTPTPEVAGETTEVRENDWVKGDPEAKVVLTEYGDFQCPACANYAPLVKRLSEETSKGLKVVYRHFPLTSIHKNAIPSAQAAEAAGRQGKFWEMHDTLYEKQTEWSDERDVKEKFIEYARILGLDEEKFKSDYDSDEVRQRIESDLSKALQLGLNSTPTFFLNGQKIAPRSYENFKDLVDDQIRGYNLQ